MFGLVVYYKSGPEGTLDEVQSPNSWNPNDFGLSPDDTVCINPLFYLINQNYVFFITGCDDLLAPENGKFSTDLDGAILRFECFPPKELIGESVLGCDGQFWNGSVPFCVSPTTTTTTSTTSRPKTNSRYSETASSARWTKVDLKTFFICSILMSFFR